MKFFVLVAYTLISLVAGAQNKHDTMKAALSSDEADVIATVRRLAKDMIARDTGSLNHILDEHYTLTHMTGYKQPKAEWFSEVERESMKYYSAEEVKHSVQLDGNRATCTVQNLVDARIWGSRNTWRLQQVMQLEKRNGKWMILSSVASVF